MKERQKHMLCCSCGFVVPTETMFIKSYKNTAIILCRQCAKNLSREIQKHYKTELVFCKDCALKYESNDGELHCCRTGMKVKSLGYCDCGTKGNTAPAEKGGK